MTNRYEQPKDIDWIVIIIYFALIMTGWLMIYASEYMADAPKSIFDTSQMSSGKQFIFIVIAMFLGGGAMLADFKFYRAFAYGFYIAGLLGLVVVLIFAKEVNGARAWINFGSFSFQGAEFAKLCTSLALAAYIASSDFNVNQAKSRLKAAGIILLPMVLIVLQKDDGSTLVYASLFLVLYRAGFPSIWYAIAFGVIALSIVALAFPLLPIIAGLVVLGCGIFLYTSEMRQPWWLAALLLIVVNIIMIKYKLLLPAIGLNVLLLLYLAWRRWGRKWQVSALIAGGVLASSLYVSSVSIVFNKVMKPHQKDRIMVWLHPEKADKAKSYYNLYMSKLAIGSGGLTGKGYLAGYKTKYGNLPEQNTDFIFCTVGEEQGFLGSALLVGLFIALLLRIIFIAERQRSAFSRFYAYCVAMIMFTHFIINIGMTMGLMPVIGIPLPFISYGGSSLISFTIMLAILVKLDSNRLLVFR